MLIDWFTVAAQAINFLILIWLLKRFLYKPVLAAVDERERLIEAQLQDAEKKKADALKEQTEFQQKNEGFEQQRSGLLLEAANAAKIERERLLATARRDSEELRSKLQRSVYDELENLNQKIGTLAQQEVFAIARKTLADLADVSLEERMTVTFMRRLHDLNDQQIGELKGFLHSSSRPVLVRSAFELTSSQKAAIVEIVRPLLGEGTQLKFETRPDLISGIELAANGQKIAWNIADYLASLTTSVGGLMESKLDPAAVSQKGIPHAA